MTAHATRLLTTSALLLLALPAAAQHQGGVPIPAQPAYDEADPAAHGQALAEYADDFDRGWVDQYSKSTMTLYDARGDHVVREVRQMTLEGESGNRGLSRFMSPADIRGVAALIHEHHGRTDDSWLYLPASRRVRRISGANRTASFQGTEFTYEDLSAVVPARYRWRYLDRTQLSVDGKSHPVERLEAVPTYSDTGYSKLIVHLNTEDWRTERIEYYDLAGRRLKTLSLTKWKHLHGRFWRALQLEMDNHQTKKRTVLAIGSLFLDMARYPRRDGTARKNLSEAQFTRAALEKF